MIGNPIGYPIGGIINTGGPVTAVGAAAGTSTATAVGASTHAAVGSSAGIATATAVGEAIVFAVGSASGTSTMLGVGIALFETVGSASGVATVSGVGTSTTAVAIPTTLIAVDETTAANLIDEPDPVPLEVA
jgi:hypothetical protein